MQLLLLASFVVLSSSIFIDSRKNRQTDDLPVCIIGAGIAGLSAAIELEKEGMDYLILEGSERVGGRVYPVKYEDGFLQYGATYINGDSNPIYEIAEANGLVDFDATNAADDYVSIYTEDEVIEGCDVREFTAFTESFATKYKEYANNGRGRETFIHAFNTDYQRFLDGKDRVSRRGHFDRLARMYVTDMETEWAALMTKYALSNYKHEQWGDESKEMTEFTLNKMGFKKILEVVKSRVDLNKIQFNSEVKEIDYTDWSSVSLTTDEEQYTCSSVIVTASLGYLKKHSRSLFKPSLPEEKNAIIQALGFGNMQKLFFVYNDAWLDKTAYHTMGANSSVIFGRGLSFDVTPWSKKTVQFWFSGRAVTEIGKMSDKELMDAVTDHLKKTLKHLRVPRPERVVRHMWYQDPLILGSYSYLTPDAVALKEPNRKLAEPIRGMSGKPLVQFAGEATHSSFYQTTIGAFLSGRREAKRLIDIYA